MRTGRKRRLIGLVCAMALLATVVMPITTAGAVVVWEDKAPPTYPHDYGGMFAISGKIYAVGRYQSEDVVNVEEYDPATNTWTTKTALNQDPQDYGSVEVDGKIYVFTEGQPSNTSDINLYDPATDTWEVKGNTTNWLRDGTAVAFNGKIYIFGGYDGDNRQTVREYNPATDAWTTKTSMPTGREFAASTVVNGKIYVIGGNHGQNLFDAVEAYDPVTDTWETKASLPIGQWMHAAVTVNGKIYALGGDRADNTVQKYDPQSDSWTIESPMHFTRTYGQVAAVMGNKIYTLSGTPYNEPPTLEVGTIPEVTGNTQATIGPAAELTLNPETLEFGSVSPTVGNYTQTRVASVKSNKNWELFVRKLSDLTGANTADVIPSSQLTFTSAAQGSPIEFNLAETLVNSGAPTAGTDSNVDYALNVGWEDQPDSYSAQHIYTVVQP